MGTPYGSVVMTFPDEATAGTAKVPSESGDPGLLALTVPSESP